MTQHVRNAAARFDQVIDVSDADRALAFSVIAEKAAKYYGVDLSGDIVAASWVSIRNSTGKRPLPGAVETKRERGELKRGCCESDRDEAQERGVARRS